VNQFAMAKALASGDPRLMQKAGLDAEVGRLERLRAAHFDDQLAVRRQILDAGHEVAHATTRIAAIEQDIAVRTPTRGDLFAMQLGSKVRTDRKSAGGSLLSRLRLMERNREKGSWTLGTIGGFEIKASGKPLGTEHYRMDVWLERHGYEQEIRLEGDLTALGLIARLEYQLDRFEAELADYRRRATEAAQRLPGYRRRVGEAFGLQEELDAKAAELAALEADLAANTVAANDDAVPKVAAA